MTDDRAIAALNLAMRRGSVADEPYLLDIVSNSTGRLMDVERDALARHLLASLAREGLYLKGDA